MLQAKIQGLSALSDKQPKSRYAYVFVQGNDVNAETYGLTPPKGNIVRTVTLDRTKETPEIGKMISFIQQGNILTETKNASASLGTEKLMDRTRAHVNKIETIDEMIGFNYKALMNNAIATGNVEDALKLRKDRLESVQKSMDESKEKSKAYRTQNTTVLSKLTLNVTAEPRTDNTPQESVLGGLEEKGGE